MPYVGLVFRAHTSVLYFYFRFQSRATCKQCKPYVTPPQVESVQLHLVPVIQRMPEGSRPASSPFLDHLNDFTNFLFFVEQTLSSTESMAESLDLLSSSEQATSITCCAGYLISIP
jgi:hypothetical protein